MVYLYIIAMAAAITILLIVILLFSDIQTATYLTTIISCIMTYISAVIALLAIVSAIKSNRPRIIVKPKKKYQNDLKRPFLSYFRYKSKFYILICITLVNNSPHKTKIHDIKLKSLEFQKKLKFVYIAKRYLIDLPAELKQTKRFDFVNDLIPITQDYVIEGYDTVSVYFVFPYRKLKNFNAKTLYLSTRVVGDIFPEGFSFKIKDKKLFTARNVTKKKNTDNNYEQSEKP